MPATVITHPVLASHVGTSRLGVEDWDFGYLIPLEMQARVVCDGCGSQPCAVQWRSTGAFECATCLQHDENLPVVLVERANVRPCIHCATSLRRSMPGAGMAPWVSVVVAEALCSLAPDSVHVAPQ